jgi:hypothetical protein
MRIFSKFSGGFKLNPLKSRGAVVNSANLKSEKIIDACSYGIGSSNENRTQNNFTQRDGYSGNVPEVLLGSCESLLDRRAQRLPDRSVSMKSLFDRSDRAASKYGEIVGDR